jgi:MHS family proline/betaine transporter-like MFS transporter
MAAAFGLIGGSLLALGFGLLFTAEQLAAWGWRLPFLIAAPLGLIGLYIRRRLEDTPVFRELERATDRPRARLCDAFRLDQWRAIAVTFSFSWICGVGLFYLGSYVVNFLSSTVRLPAAQSALLTAAGLAVYAALCPVAGRLSDRFGRRRTVLFGCIGHAVLGVPVFALLASGNVALILLALVLYAVIQAPINANTSIVLIELFPASTRLTSGSLGFNLGVGPPSGFGPLVAAALVASTGLSYSPGFFLAGVAAVCGIVLFVMMPETAGRDLLLEHDATRDAEAGPPADRVGAAEVTTRG